MLHEFLTLHRSDLIDRCRTKVAERADPDVADLKSIHGIPPFLDQLIKTLQVEQTSMPMDSRKVSGPSGGGMPVLSEIGCSAAHHGSELLNAGFTVGQVVHEYGDLCQAITDLSVELESPIAVDEFRTLNRCLDNAIAEAATEFSYQRDNVAAERRVRALNEQWGILAHQSYDLLRTAILALGAVQNGKAERPGSKGIVLERSLARLRNLIDRSLADLRVTAGIPPRSHLTSVAGFIAELAASASLEAEHHECGFTVSAVDPALAMDVDPDILFSAADHLLQNAFRFTRLHSEVSLKAHATADRITIDVQDSCGGLPTGDTERMFLPYVHVGTDTSGLGVGLSVCRRSVEAIHGKVTARDIPGSGCVFTIDLPRHAL